MLEWLIYILIICKNERRIVELKSQVYDVVVDSDW